MGIFNKIIKKLRGGAAAPNEHGPAVQAAKLRAKEVAATDALIESAKPKTTVKVQVVKATVGTNPGCACGGQCGCKPKTAPKTKAADTYTAEVKKAAVKKAATPAPSAKKPVAKTTEKKIAIAKDLADEPVVVKKPVAKKPTPKKAK